MESESNQTLPFLDVLLVKRPDGNLQRSVYRKPTWTRQYINFNSCVPLIYKWNPIRCLAYRARRICTHDTIENELVELHNILLRNGYPEKFIQVNLKHQPQTKLSITVPKKTLFIKLPFKDDIITEALKTKLNRSIANTFRCAQLKLVLTRSPMLRFNLEGQVASFDHLHVHISVHLLLWSTVYWSYEPGNYINGSRNIIRWDSLEEQ